MVDDLVCPLGEPRLTLADGGLCCPAGHRFDVARQGYANLLLGPAPAAADTTEMVAARHRIQAAGHLDEVTRGLVVAVAELAEQTGAIEGLVVDVGAGTGHHLAAVLDAVEAPAGLAVDLSKHAARRAAKAHPRIGAIVADVWRGLPVRTEAAALAMVVFAPRDAGELARIVRPGGAVVVVTPTVGHLEPLVTTLGLLQVEPDKLVVLDRRFAALGPLVARRTVEAETRLDDDEVQALVAMGPSAHHRSRQDVARRLSGLARPIEVTVSVTVSTYRAGQR